MASSCAYFPWMIVVISFATCRSTTFHTFETQGHVVSTVVTPRSSKYCISASVAPKAGKITTSPGSTASKFLSPCSVFSTNSTPESLSIWFTPGLCSNSFVMCFFFSGNFSTAARANSIERTAPQHRPYSSARRKVTFAAPSPFEVSKVDVFISSSNELFISVSMRFSTAARSSWLNAFSDRKKPSLRIIRRRSCFLFATGFASNFVASIDTRSR
mmetsp:Transcript_36151/g.115773  ORF Transcript_36151/g.115773 Transcript_36151/m.115773 type:complete len:215 (-) Transcript_36151:119-763(-)